MTLHDVTLQIEVKVADGIKEYKSLDIDRSTVFGLNYKQSDLTNPTVSSIPFSSNINIPKTKNNNQLFAHLGIRSTTDLVDPVEINFRLFVNGSILQMGYLKVESIDIEDDGYYSIRLYGNLGSFFSFLKETSISNLPVECDHKICADTVLKTMTDEELNYGYALTYQGEYDNFTSDIVQADDETLKEATWTGVTEYANPELNEHRRSKTPLSDAFFGEYRSYYQKPTVRFKPILESLIKMAEEKGGYKVEIDRENFFNEENPYYEDLWLLSNKPDVGDAPAAILIDLEEFGDTKSAISQEDKYKISENHAFKWDSSKKEEVEIKPEDFVSNSASTRINSKVLLTKNMQLEQDDIVTVEFNVRVIATSYDDRHNGGQYRGKDRALDTALDVVDADTGLSILPTPTYTASGPNQLVTTRRFNTSNVGGKRPGDKNGGFGYQKNFYYDRINSSDTSQDNGTIWKYKLTYKADRSRAVRIVFDVNGFTWWDVSKSSSAKPREYGVAFKVVNKRISVAQAEMETLEGRTNTERTFAHLVDPKHSCYDLLLSYAKLFGLHFKYDIAENKIWLGLRDQYYQDEVLQWTDRVDRSKEFSLQPSALEYRKGVFQYNPLGTKYEELYKSDVKKEIQAEDTIEYGGYNVITGYSLGSDTYNYLDGIIFDNCVLATDYSHYYYGRSDAANKDNKELPHLQDAEGGEINLNGFIPLFRDGVQKLKKNIAITDDTTLMKNYGVLCWNNYRGEQGLRTSKIARYVRTIEKDGKVYSLNLGVPGKAYGDSDTLLRDNRNGCLYYKYWRSYLTDILSADCKVLNCYVYISPSEMDSDLLSKFIHIDDSIWVIQEISGYNPVSEEPTKVKLIKVKDRKNYLDHTNLTDTFEIRHAGEVIYNNSDGAKAVAVTIGENDTEITLTISSTISWKADSLLGIDPKEETAGDKELKVSIPAGTNRGTITFKYGNSSVTIEIVRQRYVTVTASVDGGGTATINGLNSPQQVLVGSTVVFRSLKTTELLYWMVNGVKYTQASLPLTIYENTNAVAYHMVDGEVKVYCDDVFTTISGVEKVNDEYWILKTGNSYNIRNTGTDFTAFKFNDDNAFYPQGSITIKPDYNYLTAYYGMTLINLRIINLSPEHEFDASKISFLGQPLSAVVPPGATITTVVDLDELDDEDENLGVIAIERCDYHYPIVQQRFTGSINYVNIDSLGGPGIYDLRIQAYRVGWDGDKEEQLSETGVAELTYTVYGPDVEDIPWKLTFDETMEVEPAEGYGEQDIAVTVRGIGGEIVQHIGEHEYTLTLSQEGDLALGWTDEYLQEYEDTVEWTETEYTIDFYHNGLELELSEGLTKGEDQIAADGAIYSEITVEFEANTSPEQNEKIFTIVARGMEFTLTLSQEKSAVGWTDEKLLEYTVSESAVEENEETGERELTVKFYHNGLPLELGQWLTKGTDNDEGDDIIWSDITAIVPKNPYPVPNTLEYTVTIGSTVFTLYVTQEAMGNMDTIVPSESCTFDIGREDATYKDAHFCGTVYADRFEGTVTNADKVSNQLLFSNNAQIVKRYDGSSQVTVFSPYLSIVMRGRIGQSDDNGVFFQCEQDPACGYTFSVGGSSTGSITINHNIGTLIYTVICTPYFPSTSIPAGFHSNSYPRVVNKGTNSFQVLGINSDNGRFVAFQCEIIVIGRYNYQ